MAVEVENSTKIVATLGPATDPPEQLRALVEAGVDVFRLNFSHGSHAEHAGRIAAVRDAARQAGRHVAILQDLQGPKIRTGPLAGGGPVELETGAVFRLLAGDDDEGDARSVGTSYAALAEDVAKGDRILIGDGMIELRVEFSGGGAVETRVVAGGLLRERQGINLPGVAIAVPSLTEKDHEDLAFGLGKDVDWIALSFVRRASDVQELKQEIARAGRDTPVIAKIEKTEAMACYDEILAVSDAVMVARGDLGVELSPEKVPLAQKHLIERARRRSVPVITATEMLESMIEKPRPTRAEASDVANAILDGTDAVMLSGETAIGRYPVRAVETLGRIARELDRERRRRRLAGELPQASRSATSHPEAIAGAVAAIECNVSEVAAVWVMTRSGRTARFVSSQRLSVPVLGFTPDPTTARRMALFWGVHPISVEEARSEAELEQGLVDRALAAGLGTTGDTVVITGGHPLLEKGSTNFLKLRRL